MLSNSDCMNEKTEREKGTTKCIVGCTICNKYATILKMLMYVLVRPEKKRSKSSSGDISHLEGGWHVSSRQVFILLFWNQLRQFRMTVYPIFFVCYFGYWSCKRESRIFFKKNRIQSNMHLDTYDCTRFFDLNTEADHYESYTLSLSLSHKLTKYNPCLFVFQAEMTIW